MNQSTGKNTDFFRPGKETRPGYGEREYRRLTSSDRRRIFQVTVKETDLQIQVDKSDTADLESLRQTARDAILDCRAVLENWIRNHPDFAAALSPWMPSGPAPEFIRIMCAAGAAAGVGPMAAVAGAVAEYTGRALLSASREVVVENGGDLFFQCRTAPVIAVYAGDSPLSMAVGARPEIPENTPYSVCTSSGKLGHSLSLGKADAACVMAPSAALADAAATAVGNKLGRRKDMDAALAFGREIPGISGILLIKGDRLGAWGALEVLPLSGNSG